MAQLKDIKPTERPRLMDLLVETGIDVSDWANCSGGTAKAASNPRYCYRWAFRDDQKRFAVLLLWHRLMKEEAGRIFLRINHRAHATKMRDAQNWNDETRANEIDLVVQEAWRAGTPLRLIVIEGDMADRDGVTRSAVKFRRLDPRHWRVAAYDDAGGEYEIERS